MPDQDDADDQQRCAGEPVEADAREVEYDGATKTVRVRGDPARVRRGTSIVATGRELEYGLAEEPPGHEGEGGR